MVLWRREVEPDGKTVVIDADETARAVDFARKFFRDTMLDDVLGWTDVSNNKAWFAEQISCTNNAESILWLGKRDFPEIAKVTDQAQNPMGPKGRFHIMSAISHAIFSFTPAQEEARAFLRWLTTRNSSMAGTLPPTPIISRSCTAMTTPRCGRWNRVIFPIATRSRAPIYWAGRRHRAGNWRKVSPNTWSLTCSLRPALALRQKT